MLTRLHYQLWEQALLRRLGHEKNVQAKRILFLFRGSEDDSSSDRDHQFYHCVYPAQKMSTNEVSWEEKEDLFN